MPDHVTSSDRSRRLAARLAAAIVLLLGLLAAAALAVHHDLTTPYRAWAGAEVFMQVPRGAGGGEIARRLEREGVVPSALLLRAYLRLSGQGSRLHAGEYRFAEAATPIDVARRLVEGDVYLHRLTIPEGLDLDETRRLLAAAGWWSEAEIRAALDRPDLVADISPEAGNLEGYLFPETYSFPRSADAMEMVELMVRRFRHVFTPELREEGRALGLTPHEAVTLASLIEEEVQVPSEAALVASVIHNRLDAGRKLEIDASVIYGLKLEGRYRPPLRRTDLEDESPYNTYRITGLPPGPIANPGRRALEAAVRPADSDYLYYVLRPDGSGAHEFSRTWREHAAAVQRLHRARRR